MKKNRTIQLKINKKKITFISLRFYCNKQMDTLVCTVCEAVNYFPTPDAGLLYKMYY